MSMAGRRRSARWRRSAGAVRRLLNTANIATRSWTFTRAGKLTIKQAAIEMGVPETWARQLRDSRRQGGADPAPAREDMLELLASEQGKALYAKELVVFVDRVVMPLTGVLSWPVLGLDGIPLESVESHRVYLAALERSPNTRRTLPSVPE
jgi:hypothetical protein